MTFGESILSISVIPSIVASLAIAVTSKSWDLSWLGMFGVGLGGYLVGFVFAGLVLGIIEALIERRE